LPIGFVIQNDTIDLSTLTAGFWPYTRKIPETDMTMNLRFRPIPVTRDKVSAVIIASETIVNQQIKERGANTQLLVDHEGKQAFKNIVNHFGIAVRFVLSESLYSHLESQDMFGSLRFMKLTKYVSRLML